MHWSQGLRCAPKAGSGSQLAGVPSLGGALEPLTREAGCGDLLIGLLLARAEGAQGHDPGLHFHPQYRAIRI